MNAPGQIAFSSPAAAGGKTAEPSDALADCNAWRKDIHRAQHSELLLAYIECREEQSSDKAAVENSRRLEGFESEDLAGVFDVIAQVKKKHEQLGADDACHSAVDREIGDLFCRLSEPARQPQCDR